jgi:hypothetical protein
MFPSTYEQFASKIHTGLPTKWTLKLQYVATDTVTIPRVSIVSVEPIVIEIEEKLTETSLDKLASLIGNSEQLSSFLLMSCTFPLRIKLNNGSYIVLTN